MSPTWVSPDLPAIRRRYNRLAAFYRMFELLLWLPPGIRRTAVDRLQLEEGDRVLDAGCGTGRNLRRLRARVGSSGAVHGVDVSDGMLERARRLCERNGWKNVALTRGDVLEYVPPERVHAALFSLSYAVMPRRLEALRHVWEQLEPGGRLVIMDAQLPRGRMRALMKPVEPALIWFLQKTVVGDPYATPIADLRTLTDDVEVEYVAFGTYFIATAVRHET
jgi:ubiquinone/menaquinone biosynthesis C-methylase UbiE